ncbi:MAG TPA: polysaccharide biosynthesis C-terminal domain-containing protein, partial [Ferruginibacter sp.]|nr:polysaccharide biosynthesis C-terminal domain-containing protein [Ferruginibacter sp.]
VRYGLIGPAIANLVSFSVYNFVRYMFLWKKFALQPFSSKTLEVILIATGLYAICYFLFNQIDGLAGMIGRTLLYCILFMLIVYVRNISPDVKPIVQSVLNRLKTNKKN